MVLHGYLEKILVGRVPQLTYKCHVSFGEGNATWYIKYSGNHDFHKYLTSPGGIEIKPDHILYKKKISWKVGSWDPEWN